MGIVFHTFGEKSDLHKAAVAAGCEVFPQITDRDTDFMFEKMRGKRCLLVLGTHTHGAFDRLIPRVTRDKRGNQLGFLVIQNRNTTYQIRPQFVEQHGITLFNDSDLEQALEWAAGD